MRRSLTTKRKLQEEKNMNDLKKVYCCLKGFFEREWTFAEKVLLVVDCVLFGIVLGALWSPKKAKSTAIGSFNNGNGCDCDEPEDEAY